MASLGCCLGASVLRESDWMSKICVRVIVLSKLLGKILNVHIFSYLSNMLAMEFPELLLRFFASM